MTTPITEVEQWDSEISLIETTDDVLGGDTGPLNRGPKQIANRLLYLLARVAARDIAVNAAATPYALGAGAYQRHLIDIVASVPGQVINVPEPALLEARTKLFRNSSANSVTITTPLGTASFVLRIGAVALLTFYRTAVGTTVILANDPSSVVSTIRGGFGADVSAASGIPKFAAGVLSWLTAPSSAVVGVNDAQTLTAKVYDAPTLNGAISITAFTSTTKVSADGKVTTTDALVSAQTTNATQAAVYTSPALLNNAGHTLDAIVTAIRADVGVIGRWKISYSGRRASALWTQTEAPIIQVTPVGFSTYALTADVTTVSGNDFLRLLFTGAPATTIRVGVAVRVQSVVP